MRSPHQPRDEIREELRLFQPALLVALQWSALRQSPLHMKK